MPGRNMGFKNSLIMSIDISIHRGRTDMEACANTSCSEPNHYPNSCPNLSMALTKKYSATTRSDLLDRLRCHRLRIHKAGGGWGQECVPFVSKPGAARRRVAIYLVNLILAYVLQRYTKHQLETSIYLVSNYVQL